jgi:sugar lactone lactonase YvrE
MITVEQVTEPIVVHGETPTYDERTGLLHWVDMTIGDLLTMNPATPNDPNQPITRQHISSATACWRPRRSGGGVIGTRDGFAFIEPDGTLRTQPAFTDSALRMNDGGCDPQGRFYCASTAYDETPGAGSMYRLDPDGSITVVLSDLTISNGMVWSLDGTLVYYIDTPTSRIDVFDFDAERGELKNRRPSVPIDPALGHPDGLTIDADGGLWVALFAGSAVHRYEPGGTLTAVITVPASQTTACAFGGPDLDQLYITTSRRDIDPALEPQAGALFVANPGVRGVPVLMYGG